MKKVLVVVLILVCSFKLYAQHENDDLKTMVDSAISMKYSQVTARDNAAGPDDYLRDLYLINEENQPLYHTSAYDDLKLKQINIYDKKKRRLLKKGIYAWKVVTILNKNKLEVRVIDFSIVYKHNNYQFSNSGGATAIFEFSCDEGKWKLSSFHNRGI